MFHHRGITMPRYRFYVLDEHGQFVSAINVECTDDNVAKEHAKRLADGQEVELWRLVAQLKLEYSGHPK
jgi:hypothetical protein